MYVGEYVYRDMHVCICVCAGYMCKDICVCRMCVCAQECVGKDVYVGVCYVYRCLHVFMQECGYAGMRVCGILHVCLSVCM